MDIQGTRVTLDGKSDPLLPGSYLFLEPAVRLVIKSSPASVSPSWYIHVDLVDYVAAFCQAQNFTEQEIRSECLRRYLSAMHTLDIDSFEAELFWQSYEETRGIGADPYSVVD